MPSRGVYVDTTAPTTDYINSIGSHLSFLFIERISWRTSGQGTWFIQSLCEVLKLDYRRLDVMSILTRVNFLVRQYYESYVSDRAASAHCPRLVSLLTKRFDLHYPESEEEDMQI